MSGCVLVGFLARLSPEKSPGLFVQMAEHIHRHYPSLPIRFIMIGDGSLYHPLITDARRRGLGPEVMHFPGGVYSGLPDLLHDIDIIVNPSLRAWSETFCIANIEAMASGIPVVSAGVGGTGEYLINGYNSMVVDEASPQALAEAVMRLVNDEKLRESMGVRARRTVVESFTMERQLDRYDNLYQMLFFEGRKNSRSGSSSDSRR